MLPANLISLTPTPRLAKLALNAVFYKLAPGKEKILPETRLRSRLLQEAGEALKNAYAPYSGYRVGAALITRKGRVFTGCNVENASYGLTICAERAAVCAAVAREGPEMRVRALAVVSDPAVPFAPCGACRQVILEFGEDAALIFQGPDGLTERALGELLPLGFHLPEDRGEKD
jgi:cytidine deaminase